MDKKSIGSVSSVAMQSALQTPEGKKLAAYLQSNGGKTMEQAAELIKKGAYEQAIELLKPILETKETQQLVKQIQKKIG